MSHANEVVSNISGKTVAILSGSESDIPLDNRSVGVVIHCESVSTDGVLVRISTSNTAANIKPGETVTLPLRANSIFFQRDGVASSGVLVTEIF